MSDLEIIAYLQKSERDIEERLRRKRMSKLELQHVSICHWAIKELQSYVRANPDIPAEYAICKFARLMDDQATRYKTSSYIFSTGYDTAMDVLDHVL